VPAGPNSPLGSEPWDREAALARVEGDEALLAEIARLFRDDWVRLREEIGAALAEGDAARLHWAAHTAKGALSNFAAGPAGAAAVRLETLARAGDLASAADAVAVLEAELGRLLPALDQLAAAPA